jgi:hypothetical protein
LSEGGASGIANPRSSVIISAWAAVVESRNSSVVCAAVKRLSFVKTRMRCRRVSFNSLDRHVKRIL